MEQVKDKKQQAAFVTAIISFCAGWGLTIAGFCVPPAGEVSGSVLAVLGEAMVYAASVFGVGMYFNHELRKFRSETRKYIQEIEEEKDADDESES